MTLSKEILEQLKQLAEESAKEQNYPTGAILLDKSQNIVATQASQVQTLSDPTAHADLLLIQNFCRNNKVMNLAKYSVITILEPSLMAISACSWAGIGQISYILPAKLYYSDMKWMTESLDIDKQKVVSKFDSKVRIEYLSEYTGDFDELFRHLMNLEHHP